MEEVPFGLGPGGQFSSIRVGLELICLVARHSHVRLPTKADGNRARPARINPFKDERGVINVSIQSVALRPADISMCEQYGTGKDTEPEKQLTRDVKPDSLRRGVPLFP